MLPPDISPLFAVLLMAASFVTSAITAAFSIGGGAALLAVMATGLPVTTLIPVHGVVQLGSNFGRAVVQRAHIDWPLTLVFCAAGGVGAIGAGATIISVPDAPLTLVIAGFILVMAWGPKPRALGEGWAAFTAGAGLSGALTMYVGATGPMTAALLAARKLNRLTQVATFASCMSGQHIIKTVVFGALGFAFGPWALLITAMIVTGFLGTLVGTRLLHALPERIFRAGFKLMLTALALQLGADAVLALWR